jgi:4,5-DOPA dioxygenase extradiol
MKEHLGGLSQSYPKPKAVIVISAHWEEPEFTILDEDAPGLYFDYYGFPAEAYKYKYDATSTPELRQEVMAAVAEGGIKLKTKGKRGYDHGVFIPLMMIYPKADIPVIAISL